MNESSGDTATAPTRKHVAPLIFCAKCGYNLAGLESAFTCPECGTEVSSSLRAGGVQFISREFAERLHRGAILAEIGSVLAVFGVIPVAIFVFAVKISSGLNPSSQRAVESVCDFAIALLLCFGWWWVGTPHPVEDEVGTDRRRARLRAGALAKLLIASLVCATALTGSGGLLIRPIWLSAAKYANLLATIAVSALAVSYIRAIAWRLGGAEVSFLAKLRLGYFKWVAGFIAIPSLLLLVDAAASPSGVGLRVAATLLAIPAVPVTIVWFFLYIGVVDRARRLFRDALLWHIRAEIRSEVHPDSTPTVE